MNLVDDLPRSATAHAIEDTRVLALEKSRLSGLLLSYPEIGIGTMRAISLKISEGHDRFDQQQKERNNEDDTKR